MSLISTDAGPAEILRASQKDISYVNNLQQNVLEIYRHFFGSRSVIIYSPYIKLITEISYYGYLALCNLQTLGEEYTGIMQVDPSFITIPSKQLHFLSILLQCGGERLFRKIILNSQRSLQNNKQLQPRIRHIILNLLSALINLQPFFQEFHRSLFFLAGGHFHISKRITGINYILVRHWMKNHNFERGFKLLGIITMVHSLINAVKIAKESKNCLTLECTLENEKNISQDEQESNNSCKCTLCLCAAKNTCALTCGHIFCKDCIDDCLNTKPECPVCREPMSRLHIIHLQNLV